MMSLDSGIISPAGKSIFEHFHSIHINEFSFCECLSMVVLAVFLFTGSSFFF